MPICNFICGFDPVTRITDLPKDKNGQLYPMDFWHLTKERGSTVVVQVRAEQTVIDAMKADPKYFFLEEKQTDVTKPAVLLTSATAAKTFITKTIAAVDVNKQVWTTPVKAVESVVKLMGATLANYKAGGVGETPVVKVEAPAPVKNPVVITK